MERQLLRKFEYGAAKNGGSLWLLPEINCVLFDWKGDVLLEEWIEILMYQLGEIESHKIFGAIGDTTNMGPTGEEHDRWVQEVYQAKIVSTGLRRLAIVLPDDVLGEMAMQEMIENMKNRKSERDSELQIRYVNNVEEAILWMKS